MQRYDLPPLSAKANAWLASRQAKVDGNPTHRERHEAARKLWKQKAARSLNEIKAVLANASPRHTCYYCERDRYRDIDHLRPMRHYPDHAFKWENYVYACSICNQDKKRDRCAIVTEDGTIVETADSTPTGIFAQIDIRVESPDDFLRLDIGSGEFLIHAADKVSRARGAYTIQLFDLNHPVLMRDRRSNARHLEQYWQRLMAARAIHDRAAEQRSLDEIAELAFPTVFVELRRNGNKPIRQEIAPHDP